MAHSHLREKVRCTGCGETFQRRGFPTHNKYNHGGEADAEPVEGPGADGGDADGGTDTPDAGPADAGTGDAGGGPDAGDGGDADAFDAEDTEVEGDPDAGDVRDAVEDTEADARDYTCGNCGHPVEYLGGEDLDGGGKACPECGERLLWSKV